ncbi:MAG: nitrite reductase (NAD(P)H) small subunit [Gammaproteobacteria bacterium]|nr:MAG: nitrite reductase (NAD(P)H) small subunit [Gammaproteobacteria bacterium]
MTDLSKVENDPWEKICPLEELPLDAGVAALISQGTSQEQQIALFRPRDSADIYAISNFDPFSDANVLARGILCSIDGELAVASPVLKEHFSLTTGQCFEDESVVVNTYPVKISDGTVFVQANSKGGK